MTLPIGSISSLFFETLIETSSWFAILLILCLFIRLTKEYSTLKLFIGSALLLAALIFYSFSVSKADALQCLVNSGFIAFLLYFFPGLDIEYSELPFLTLMFSVPPHHFNSTSMVFASGYYFMILLIAGIGYSFASGKIKTEPSIMLYMRYVTVCFFGIIYFSINDCILTIFRYVLDSNPLFLVISEILTCAVLIYIYLLIIKKNRSSIVSIRRIGLRTPSLNKYVCFFTFLTFIILSCTHLPFIFSRTSSEILQQMLTVFFIIIFLMQFSFLVVLSLSLDYRTNLNQFHQNSDMKQQYYNSLNANLDAMADIRHDLKNLLLTMGKYVERNDDSEMKDFFTQKVYPLAANQLNRNDIFSKLSGIPDDILRSFFYMKIEQMISSGISVQVKVTVPAEDYCPKMDIIDLIRILGILLDNASEAASFVSNGYVYISVAANKEQISYSIKNNYTGTIPNEYRSRGQSGKASHSGLGLSIINKILEMYPNAALNTVIKEDVFEQILNIF